jgi:YVTN family beta-propeller protein
MNRLARRSVLAAMLALVVSLHASAQDPGERQTLVVGCKWNDAVGFYDAQTGQARSLVQIGRRPHELAASADGKLAYATLYGIDFYYDTAEGGRSIGILDLVGRRKVGEIDLGKYRRPHGIEVGRKSGLLYVTCDHPAALLIVDPAQRKVLAAIELADLKALPHMVAVDHDERRAYVANSGNGTVSAIDLASRKEMMQIPIGGIPMGIALTANGGTLFATNRTADGVAVIDTAAAKSKRIIAISGQPVRCLLTPDERKLLVTLIDSGELALVDVASLSLEKRLPIGQRVEGLLVTSDGRYVYAAAQADNKVVKVSLSEWRPILEIKTAERPDPMLVVPQARESPTRP